MSTLLFANNAGSTLSGAITNVSTTLSVASGAGALFPNPTAGQYFVLTLVDAATGLLREIMWCTSRTGDVLTVTRGQEGTVAQAWNPGDLVQCLITAGMLAQMLQVGSAPASVIYFGADAGAVNAIAATVTPSIGALVDGNIFEINIAYANTLAAVTCNISSLGIYNVKRPDGTPLLIGDLGAPPYKALMAWDAADTEFLLLNPLTWVSQPPPQKLTANLPLYVSTTGSDSNNGLTIGAPFLTLQHAWNVLVSQYNLNGYTATIQLADGTYAGGLIASSMPLAVPGTSSVIIQGNAGTPANVLLSVSSANAIETTGPVGIVVQNMKLQSTGASNLLFASNGANISFTNLVFGAVTGSDSHIVATNGGSITATGNYAISAGAYAHWSALNGGNILLASGITVTITGTPAFSNAFAIASNVGNISAVSTTFSGSATGQRYTAVLNGVIYTNNAGSTYLPGNSGGATANGGIYY